MSHAGILLLQLVQEEASRRSPMQVLAPIGIGYVAARLECEARDVTVRLVGRHGRAADTVRGMVEAQGPAILGISATGNEFAEIAGVAASAKAVRPATTVVAGGYCSMEAKRLLAETRTDIVVIGEGEETMAELARVLLDGEGTLREVRGIAFRSSQGIIQNPPRPPIEDLDALPTPWYEHDPPASPSIAVYASRGCPFRCSFCRIGSHFGTPRLRRHGKAFMRGLLERLLSGRQGVRYLVFNDDEFLLSPRHFEHMAELSREFGLLMVFQTRTADVVRHRELIDRYRDSIQQVHLGVESFAQSQLDRWRKDTTAAVNREALAALSQIGCSYYPYIILSDDRTTPDEIEANCAGLLDMPECPFDMDGVRASMSPLHYGIHLNRFKLFNGEAARSPNSEYLEAVWDYVLTTRPHAGRLWSLCRHAVRGGRRLAAGYSAMTDALDRRIREIGRLARHVEPLPDPAARKAAAAEYSRNFLHQAEAASLEYMAASLSEPI